MLRENVRIYEIVKQDQRQWTVRKAVLEHEGMCAVDEGIVGVDEDVVIKGLTWYGILCLPTETTIVISHHLIVKKEC